MVVAEGAQHGDLALELVERREVDDTRLERAHRHRQRMVRRRVYGARAPAPEAGTEVQPPPRHDRQLLDARISHRRAQRIIGRRGARALVLLVLLVVVIVVVAKGILDTLPRQRGSQRARARWAGTWKACALSASATGRVREVEGGGDGGALERRLE